MSNKFKKIINQKLSIKNIKFDEPMVPYTSFKIGGPADVVLIPETLSELTACLSFSTSHNFPVLILGGCTNVLVSDQGIRGIVILTTELKKIEVKQNLIIAESGATITDLCQKAFEYSLGGLEFINGMPGSIGGAVWMNARCYGGEIADILKEVKILGHQYKLEKFNFNKKDFSYKKSPFQNIPNFIYQIILELKNANPDIIKRLMDQNLLDRTNKGHFQFPSAGSIFKNNRDFGAPTGKILDELGLRGYQIGGAQIAPYHGNIFININNAKAADILSLMKHAQRLALEKKQIQLEPEICFVGEWDKEDIKF